jgi:hypothetical protein
MAATFCSWLTHLRRSVSKRAISKRNEDLRGENSLVMSEQARFSFVRGVSVFKLQKEKGFPAGLTENVRTEDQSTQTRRSIEV